MQNQFQFRSSATAHSLPLREVLKPVHAKAAIITFFLFLSAGAAVAGDRVCVQCDLPVGELAEKCAPRDQARALLCINDIFALTAYLEDTKQICRAKQPSMDALEAEFTKVGVAIRKEAKKRPRASSVSVVRDILVRMHPCK